MADSNVVSPPRPSEGTVEESCHADYSSKIDRRKAIAGFRSFLMPYIFLELHRKNVDADILGKCWIYSLVVGAKVSFVETE